MFYSLGKPFENAHYVSSNFTRRVSYTDGKNLLVVALVRRVEQLHNNSKSYRRCYRKGYLIPEGSLQEKMTIAYCCSNVYCLFFLWHGLHCSVRFVLVWASDTIIRLVKFNVRCRSNRPQARQTSAGHIPSHRNYY